MRAISFAPVMPPSNRQRRFMQILVIMGAVTFFARCWDQAQPYLKVINKKPGAQQSR